ncbi:GntR family transcriptional regulator [Streptomyces sp. NPDC088925]|uniref:GntR family transcriptional regulator n=1 Tax=Streptomyces sp. NPDC088925 TaxID=3365914 RepID=UPI00381CF623
MPRYEQVADDLRTRIHEGEYAIGSKLPTYAELTTTYGVGRGVIASALTVLEREGLVRIVKKAGIRVLDWRVQRRRISRGQLIFRDPRRGYVGPAAASPDEPWDTHGKPVTSYEPVPERIAELLGVEAGIAVLRRRRVTSPAGEPPFQVVDTWLSAEAVRDAPKAAAAQTGPGGYLDRLEESGHGPLTWTEYGRGRLATREEASLLDVSADAPVFELVWTGRSAQTERIIEVTSRVIPADRVELVSELRRDESATWPVEPVTPRP